MRDDTSMASLNITLNLFEVHTWMTCDNQDQGFTDEVLRTEVIAGQNNSFYIRVPYKEFDRVMLAFYKQYGLLDESNIKPPPVADKDKYNGLIKPSINCAKDYIACVFHRKDYVVTNYEDAVFNCLFSNTTPMN